MQITSAHIPTLANALTQAVQDGKDWLAFDGEIQLLSAYDLHFFPSADKAADFQLFNHQQDKEVTLLPVEALLNYLRDHARNDIRQGKPFSALEIDDEKVLQYYANMQFDYKTAELEQLIDSYNWNQAVYHPGTNTNDNNTIEEKIVNSTMHFLVEQLSMLAQFNDRGREWVQQTMERHWAGKPMAMFIPEILSGKILQYSTQQVNKTIHMTQKNLEFLQNQLKTAGFNESIFPELEKNMQEGKENFTLSDSLVYEKDQLSAVLYFARSKQEGSDMYFFNKYDATLRNETINATQTFFINNKGQSIEAKEAANMLNGRSVYKEVSPRDGEPYKAWLKLDFSEQDEHGNNKMQYIHQKYGFNLKEAIGRIELKEMANPEKMEELFRAIQRGDLVSATLIKGEKEIPVGITADPKYKTLKLFAEDGSKLYMPGPKPDARYGQAPVDEKRAAELSPGDLLAKQPESVQPELKNTTDKKKELLASNKKDHNLIVKNRERQGKGQRIS